MTVEAKIVAPRIPGHCGGNHSIEGLRGACRPKATLTAWQNCITGA